MVGVGGGVMAIIHLALKLPIFALVFFGIAVAEIGGYGIIQPASESFSKSVNHLEREVGDELEKSVQLFGQKIANANNLRDSCVRKNRHSLSGKRELSEAKLPPEFLE